MWLTLGMLVCLRQQNDTVTLMKAVLHTAY